MYFQAEDGANLYYEINGPKKGRPILFLHGWGVGSSFFSEQIPVLVNEGYRVITMDARGHGKSDKDSKYVKRYEDQLLDLMYSDFKDLLNHLGLKKQFTLIGHSAGGGISLVFATQTELRKKISTMVLINSAYTISEHASVLLLWELIPLFVNVIYNPVLRSGYKLILRSEATISALSLALQRPRSNVKGWIEDLISIPKQQLIREYQNFKRYNIKKHLKDVKCPTLIIGADLDMLTPLYMSKFMAKEIPNAELFVVKNAGHGAMIQQPRLINKKIIEFLRKHFPA